MFNINAHIIYYSRERDVACARHYVTYADAPRVHEYQTIHVILGAHMLMLQAVELMRGWGLKPDKFEEKEKARLEKEKVCVHFQNKSLNIENTPSHFSHAE